MSEEREIPHYFKYDHKSYQIAKVSASRLVQEHNVLEYLEEAKPLFLSIADSRLGLDAVELRKHVLGIGEKLAIHGYPERNQRLRYLYTILTKKLQDQDDFLKMITKFLFEMSERPTSLIRLDVGNVEYSQLPDEQLVKEKVISDKELLKEILGDEKDEITISYSSDSNLSEWSSDGEEEEAKKVKFEDFPKASPSIKTSQTFSDFSSILQDDETKRRETAMYWALEATKGRKLWKLGESIQTVIPLKNQPVVTGLLTLNTKFGEYWEWKHIANQEDQRFIIPEEIVLKELVWQFVVLKPSCSLIFNSDWTLKPGLLTSSLTHSAFLALIEPIASALRSLYDFKSFANRVTQDLDSKKTSKILLSYAYALFNILRFVAETAESMEGRISGSKKDDSDADVGITNACTTLYQLVRILQPLLNCIRTLGTFHKNLFQSSVGSGEGLIEGDTGLKLFMELSIKLNEQMDPLKFGCFLFLFSECLVAFLDEINTSFSLSWSDHILFTRNADVKLSDPNFWTDSFQLRGMNFQGGKNSGKDGSIPSCYDNLLAQVILILKTSGMIKHLEEDCVKIIGHPPLARDVVDSFFEFMFQNQQQQESEHPVPSTTTEWAPDYEKHLRFLGLHNSFEAQALLPVIQNSVPSFRGTSHSIQHSKEWLFKLKSTPIMTHWDALELAFNKFYEPVCTRAKGCIYRIFKDNSVEDGLRLFREIVLETREDFAKAILALVNDGAGSGRYKWQDPSSRNPAFQKLLSDCYPEGRDNFQIEMKLDPTLDTKYTLIAKPHFPLNLIIMEDTLEGYLFVSQQLCRIRKDLWDISDLSIKDFATIEGVEPNRMLLFRFALIHFCSSLRAYLVFKVFGRSIINLGATNQPYDLDHFRGLHRRHMKSIELEILRDPVIEKVILRKLGEMCRALQKLWKLGIPSRTMVLLEDTLKKCWNAILSFRRQSQDFEELSYYFGPVPAHL